MMPAAGSAARLRPSLLLAGELVLRLRIETRHAAVRLRVYQLTDRVVYLNAFLTEPGVDSLNKITLQGKATCAVDSLNEHPEIYVGVAELREPEEGL